MTIVCRMITWLLNTTLAWIWRMNLSSSGGTWKMKRSTSQFIRWNPKKLSERKRLLFTRSRRIYLLHRRNSSVLSTTARRVGSTATIATKISASSRSFRSIMGQISKRLKSLYKTVRNISVTSWLLSTDLHISSSLCLVGLLKIIIYSLLLYCLFLLYSIAYRFTIERHRKWAGQM